MKNKVENLIRERDLLVGRLNGYRRVQEVVSESRTSKVKVSADTVSGVSVLVDRMEFLNILSDSKRAQVISDCYFGIARFYLHNRQYWPMCKNLMLSILQKPYHQQTKSKIHMMVFPKKHLLITK